MNNNYKDRLNAINDDLTTKDALILEALALTLDKAEREGNSIDEPEGTRYIMLSDKMSKDTSKKLKKISRKILEQINK